jgi:hypothetical protein
MYPHLRFYGFMSEREAMYTRRPSLMPSLVVRRSRDIAAICATPPDFQKGKKKPRQAKSNDGDGSRSEH